MVIMLISIDRLMNPYGRKAPNDYFNVALKQCSTKVAECGSIIDEEQLYANLSANCIPEDVFNMGHEEYELFLEKRRLLMAKKIRKYYENL